MCVALSGGLGVFLCALAVHVVVWRFRRPRSYRAWLPLLVAIFGPLAAAIAWTIAPTALDAAAILLLHGSLAAVYTVGYTLLSAASPSVELLKVIDRAPDGLPAASLCLPFLSGALSSDRIDNLTTSGLVRRHGDRLDLAPSGIWLTRLVLLYRHGVGLRDGGGG